MSHTPPPSPSPTPPDPEDGITPQQGIYPPPQGGAQPQQGAHLADQGAGHPQQDAYPPQQGTYPPHQETYPPQQGAYPPQQGAYPADQGAGHPQQGLYPPPQGAYPPQQETYPPPQLQHGARAGKAPKGPRTGRVKRWLITIGGLAIVVVIALFVAVNFLGLGWTSSGPGKALSKAWLSEPQQVWQIDDFRAIVPADSSRYLTVVTGESVVVVDVETGTSQFVIDGLNTDDVDYERLTQFGDDTVLNTHAGPGAGAYALPSGEHTATAEFTAATERDDFHWSGNATYSELNSADSPVEVEVYDPLTTELVHSCALEQTSGGNSGLEIDKLAVHFDGNSALLQREDSRVEVVDLTSCTITAVDLNAVNEKAQEDGPIDLEHITPTIDGWWVAGQYLDHDHPRTFQISPAGKVTGGGILIAGPAIFGPGFGGQHFSADELDSAFGLRQPLSAQSTTYMKIGGKLHVWLSGSGGGFGGNHYLDGEVVPGLTTWAIFISDFDHALTSSDGELALVSLDTDEARWSISGNWAIPIGNRLVVGGADADTLTGYAPGSD